MSLLLIDAVDGFRVSKSLRHTTLPPEDDAAEEDAEQTDEESTLPLTPARTRHRHASKRSPHHSTTRMAPLGIPSILTIEDDKILKSYMKQWKAKALHFKHESTHNGICTSTMHLTACVERGSGQTVSCMTQLLPASAPPTCEFYAVAENGKIPPGIAVQGITERLMVHSLPPIHHLDFANLKALVLENVIIPQGVHALRLANVTLTGYPTHGFQNVSLASSMRRVALRHNLITSFDPTEWAKFLLEDLFLENNLLRTFVNVTFPPTITTLDLRNNVIKSFVHTTLHLALTSFGRQVVAFQTTVEGVPVRTLTRLVMGRTEEGV
ncbi:hypothetical protein H257_04076 [Aphanomyces astaci]|uniref:Uncharacterized protein n=1 Tax=Aphanomyces astaci TaxID=112090 RepID=W4GUB0_APHAT|nr:hypothetical protein H257_04076 [Aphanomyces astaci]ETV83325.1 hypothetical protein H257_04076 [Aphanomyces astaci]|eukprot:XP_009826755.1 hypothetical protein H257_04076 [Aphanomyces astaci]